MVAPHIILMLDTTCMSHCPPQLVTLRNFRLPQVHSSRRGQQQTAQALPKQGFRKIARRRQLSFLSCSGESAAGVSRPAAPGDPRKPTTSEKQPPEAASASRDNSTVPSNEAASQSSGHQAEQQASLTGLKPFHVAAFAAILACGLAFLAVLLYITADMQFQRACIKVVKRLLKTVALRQVMGILAAMTFVRFGLEPLVKVLRRVFSAQGTWEKSSEYYILREVGVLWDSFLCRCSGLHYLHAHYEHDQSLSARPELHLTLCSLCAGVQAA